MKTYSCSNCDNRMYPKLKKRVPHALKPKIKAKESKR